jgi:flagellar biosynthesis GTPase FlhF
MSEGGPKNLENFESLEALEASEEQQHALPEHLTANKEQLEQEQRAMHEAAQETAEVEATTENPVEQFVANEEADKPAQSMHVNRELKSMTAQRELKRIQRDLPRGQRTLSKVIHQPVIRNISEATGKTVTRPSGLLGGGVVAFVGTSSYLYLTKHVGMQYNYTVMLALFIGGFLLGLGIELAVHFFLRKRHEQ